MLSRFRSLAPVCLALTLWLAWSPPLTAEPNPTLTNEITAVLQEGVEAWNAGDLPKFMGGYLDSPDMTFTSAARLIRGHEALQKRYTDTYGSDKRSMGQLRFSHVEVWPLGSDHALALGQWHLEVTARTGRPTKETMEGIFSLVLLKTPQGWKILHDHTSRSQEKKPEPHPP